MKLRFRIIIILMAVSLFGIIIVQGLWISHAKRSEEALFDKAVYEAMNLAVRNLGQNEIFYFLDKKIDLPVPPSMSFTEIDSVMKVSVSGGTTHNYKLRGFETTDEDQTVVVTIDSSGRTVVKSVSVHSGTNAEGNDSLAGNVEVEFIMNNNGAQQQLANAYVLDSLEKVLAEKQVIVEQKMEQFNKGMMKWAYEYSFDDELFSGMAFDESLDTILRRSFRNKGIDLAFDYQVVKVSEDSIRVLKSGKENGHLLPQTYMTEVYPDDFFRKNLFLVVDFPERSQHIFRSVALLVSGSVIFTLIILLTFGLTLFYIHRQKRISEVKSDFINNMTHEFKTPIATISLASDALGSPKVMGKEKQTRYYLDIIRQENKRMNNQVEKVLQMALIENHDLNLDFRKADIHPVIENVAEVSGLAAKEKGGKIITALRAGCSDIMMDEVHFANILNNLLDNALKYTEKPPEILVETFNEGNKVFIRISDNGTGMGKEVQKHIFDKFYRKPEGNIHNVKGFGLGLSYVRAIVDAHGGEVSVSSEPGNGSVFTLGFDC